MVKTLGWLGYTEYSKFPLHRHRTEILIKGVQRFAEGKRKLKIIELGCGKGNIAIPLGALGHEVLGIDLDSKTLDTARKNNPFNHVSFKKAEVGEFITKLGKGVSKYDAIILSEILEHLDTPESLVRLLGKNTKKGTRLFITVPNGYSYWEGVTYILHRVRRMRGLRPAYFKIRNLLGKKDPCSEDEQDLHLTWFSFRKLKKMLENEGFNIIRTKNLFFIYNPIQCFMPFVNVPESLLKAELKVAEILPHAMVNGWFLECVKEG